ncbi:hypothetical protein BGZ70_001484 [Mortierella alpina]|uniref:Arrestin C-terminal-like domain-containing protein n=1 Tax=Mortierella alpina TaxID=64518 RepID=A0A9P6IW90_MORAP|nr:hypothetical protein BGZ70_001484 [Mortierella alpina]
MVLIPIGPKDRKLLIHVDTGNSTIGPRELPLVYGHQDAITMLHATVSFESSHDCKAKAIEIMFKAAVRTGFFSKDEASRKHEGEQVFYSKQWTLDVERPKPGWISKGSYARQCSVVLDPSLPSSSESPYGSMKYVFEARLKGAKGIGIARTDHVVTQEVWVLNSSLPSLEAMPPPLDQPLKAEEQWANALRYSFSVPSNVLYQGQVVPITVQLDPFMISSAYEGEEAVVSSANFTLRETKTFRAMFVRDTHTTQAKVLQIPVNAGWPQSVEGWARTIHITLPSSPALSTDLRSKYLDITHTLEVVVEFKTSKMSKPEKLRALFDVQITAPRPYSAEPPLYGESVLAVESQLPIEPPPAMDEEELLPGYSRYE